MRTPRLLRARVPLGGEKKIWDRLAVFAVEGIPTRDLERRPSAYFRYCVDASCAEQIGELSSTVFVHHICPVEISLSVPKCNLAHNKIDTEK